MSQSAPERMNVRRVCQYTPGGRQPDRAHLNDGGEHEAAPLPQVPASAISAAPPLGPPEVGNRRLPTLHTHTPGSMRPSPSLS